MTGAANLSYAFFVCCIAAAGWSVGHVAIDCAIMFLVLCHGACFYAEFLESWKIILSLPFRSFL